MYTITLFSIMRSSWKPPRRRPRHQHRIQRRSTPITLKQIAFTFDHILASLRESECGQSVSEPNEAHFSKKSNCEDFADYEATMAGNDDRPMNLAIQIVPKIIALILYYFIPLKDPSSQSLFQHYQ